MPFFDCTDSALINQVPVQTKPALFELQVTLLVAPLLGVSKPVSMRIVVVLPQPLGPRNPYICPFHGFIAQIV